jgi:hypothetical protein
LERKATLVAPLGPIVTATELTFVPGRSTGAPGLPPGGAIATCATPPDAQAIAKLPSGPTAPSNCVSPPDSLPTAVGALNVPFASPVASNGVAPSEVSTSDRPCGVMKAWAVALSCGPPLGVIVTGDDHWPGAASADAGTRAASAAARTTGREDRIPE